MSERTLSDLGGDVLQAGGWVTSGIVLGTIIAVVFIYLATPAYRAQMIISPANPLIGGADLAPAPGNDNFSALRYLIQRGVVGGSADFQRFESMIAGPTVAAKLLQDEKIRRGLSFDTSFSFSKPRQDWTPEGLAEYIGQRVKLEPVGASALRRVVYLHPSREFGVYLLHSLHRVTDDLIHSNARQEAVDRVAYLQQQSEHTINPEHRRAITSLLMEQERVLMLASIDQPFAASVVEPPAGSQRTHWPDALMIVPVLMFAGALIGFMLHALFRGAPEDAEVTFTVSRPAWFSPENTNTNERKLKPRKAAE